MQLRLENSKLKKGHNYVEKNLSVTCPTGMGSLLIVNNCCELQVNIFSNNIDIRKYQSICMMTLPPRKAMTIP